MSDYEISVIVYTCTTLLGAAFAWKGPFRSMNRLATGVLIATPAMAAAVPADTWTLLQLLPFLAIVVVSGSIVAAVGDKIAGET